MAQIPNDILIAALAGFKLERQRIDEQIEAVEAMLGGKAERSTVAVDGSASGRKKFSAATRKKMAAAQKARWAKLKSESQPEPPVMPEPPKPKRRISPEGMKRIIAATKARWRRQSAAKAEGGAAEKSTPKRAAKKAAVKKTPAKRTTPAVAGAGAGQ